MNNAATKSLVPHILFVMFALELGFIFVKKIDSTVYGIFDLVEKLYPIIALTLIFGFMQPKLNRYWRQAIVLYLAYLVYGVLISLANQKSGHIIGVQIYHELKFFPVIFIYAITQSDDRWSPRTLKIIKPIIALTLVLVFFQLATPGAYDALFKNGGHFEKAHVFGMSLPRLVGWFWHPGQIALFFLITAVFVIVQRRQGNVQFTASFLCLCILFVLISVQRFELFILLMILLLIWGCRYMPIDVRPYLAKLIILLFGGIVLYLITDEMKFWKILELFESPRMVFLVEALFTLQESSYLGAGWGTIGSHAAADVANVYEYNAMKDLWWIKMELYFYDTYWPHVIGETGLPGVFLLLFAMASMIRALKKTEASILLFVLILTSAFSSNVQSLYHLCIFGWVIFLLENTPVEKATKKSTMAVTVSPVKTSGLAVAQGT